jgi:hypothetical protein
MTELALFGGRVRVGLPGDWDERTVYTFVAPARTSDLPTLSEVNEPRVNVVVTREAAQATTLDELVARYRADAAGQLPQFRVLEDAARTVDARPAVERVFTFEIQNSVVQQSQVVVMAGAWAYTLTFTSTVASFAADRAVFERVLGSLRFAPEAP